MHTSRDPPGQSDPPLCVVVCVALDVVAPVVLVVDGGLVGDEDPPMADASIPKVEKWILAFFKL